MAGSHELDNTLMRPVGRKKILAANNRELTRIGADSIGVHFALIRG
jgi:hypothetical protein